MTRQTTQHVGLIGWPVEHSVSPAMHNAAFEALGLPWRYKLLPTPPDKVKAVLTSLAAQGYRGANVTVPHKQAVMPTLDEITDDAQAIGAVNTIVVQQDHLIGHNTDGDGFLASLRKEGFDLAGKQALVLGAGGAARAVVHALGKSGCAVTIHNRTARRAEKLAYDMQASFAADLQSTAAVSVSRLDLDRFDLLVNTTSVGMWPQIDACPWPAGRPLPPHWTVCDLVYNPAETQLLVQAEALGARPIGGLGMLVHQGELAFELWTGRLAPIEVMRAAAEDALLHL